jgi:hypothetical protein
MRREWHSSILGLAAISILSPLAVATLSVALGACAGDGSDNSDTSANDTEEASRHRRDASPPPDASAPTDSSHPTDSAAIDAGSDAATSCGFIMTSPLALTAATISVGSTLGGKVTYTNTCASAMSIGAVAITSRPPGGTNGGGPYDDFAPSQAATTVNAGASVTLTASRAFTSGDPTGNWYAYATYKDSGGVWHDGPSVPFTVAAPAIDAGGGAGSDAGPDASGFDAGSGATGLHVVGNKLYDGNGTIVHLHGANREGAEYACIQGWGLFEGPSDAASVQAMANWRINSVRVLLNEDCWLGINGVAAAYGGANYQNAIVNYVKLLHQYGIYAELGLMYSAPGTTPAKSSPEMPNTDHSITFWQQVASTFKSDGMAFFDLFNEPHNVSWACWLNGGSSCSLGFAVAGMQSLVNAVRSTGATNVIAVPGIDYANNLTGWLANRPSDPAGQLIAEAHVYGGNTCQDVSCWNSQLAPVAAQVPLHTGELGGNYQGTDCSGAFTQSFVNWADPLGVSYQLWTWNTWGNCSAMISDYTGTPYGNGVFYKQHLATLP